MISVIVPIYNVEKYIRKCIDSILAQTYKDTEIILVDDGSPDHCGAICDEYQALDERIQVIHKENGGLSDARNAGLDIAKGEYIAFVDSDDYLHPDYLQTMYNQIIEDQSDLVICGLELVNESSHKLDIQLPAYDNKKIWTQEDFWQTYYHRIRNACTMIPGNKLYRQELWKSTRYPVGVLHEDEYVCHDLVRQCNKISVINLPLYYYVQRNDSITKKKSVKNYVDRLRAYEQRMDYFEQNGLYAFQELSIYDISLELVYLLKYHGDEQKFGINLHQECKKTRKKYKELAKRQLNNKLLKHGICFSLGLRFYSFILLGHIKSKGF